MSVADLLLQTALLRNLYSNILPASYRHTQRCVPVMLGSARLYRFHNTFFLNVVFACAIKTLTSPSRDIIRQLKSPLIRPDSIQP